MTRVTRRRWLSGTLATAVAGIAAPAFPEQLQTHRAPGITPRVKGPLVFLDYDQEELDDSYTQVLWAPNQEQLARRNAQKSAQALARLGPPRRLSYGTSPAEQLDVYVTKASNAPIHIYVHGGAWRFSNAAENAYQSEMFVDAGAHFVAIDFNSVIETKGDLLPMANQVRRAVAWVYRNARTFGGDPGRLYLSGHSSGAHLAGVALTTDWRKDFQLPSNLVKGALLASGLYDLIPVSLSVRSSYVNFTPGTIDVLSSMRHLNALTTPLIVAYGTLETPEFQRQSREFAAAVKAAGKSVDLVALDGYNHFEVAESLGNPYGVLGRAVLAQMNRRRS